MAARKPLSRTARLGRWTREHSVTHKVPALAVFGVAAYQSYWHTVDVVASHTRDHAEGAYIMAAATDGLMIVAARYITHAQTRLGKALAAGGFTLGVAATVTANILAADPDPVSRGVAVFPALALIATALILHFGNRPAKRPARRPATKTAKAQAPAKATVETAPETRILADGHRVRVPATT
jgi:peptidoglycan/LPS O-acetylase OafA/YrhL